MKFAVLIATFVAAFSIQNSAWAKDEAQEALQAELCEGMLGHTLTSLNGLAFEFDVMKGLGARGFLGSFPEPTADNADRAASQGVFYWGHSIAVANNVMAAAHHDAKFKGLSKILYFISDVDVSDLNDGTDHAIVQARYSQIFEKSEIIYFDEVNGQQIVRGVSKSFSSRLMHPKKIEYFTKDDRGPRFTQGGWVFPKIRGVLTYKNVFQSGSDTIKKIIKAARALENKGYTFTFNQNFEEALGKARDQVRIEQGENGVLKAIPDGSRYRDPKHDEGVVSDEYKMALEGFAKGINVSMEVRDSQGRMVAGIIGQRHGNVWAWDTIFYDFTTRDGSRYYTSAELAAMPDAREAKSLIDLAKMAALGALLRLHDHGIDFADAGMVTKFTAGLKGVYVPGEEFAGYVQELAARPQIQVDLTKPFSFVSRQE